MFDLVYVCSQNGLGHARRGALICSQIAELGIRTLLITTEEQRKFLFDEIAGQNSNFAWLTLNERMGLDGPWSLKSSSPVGPKNSAGWLIDELEAARSVIGDNVCWPAQFSDNFHVFGHFLWIDYYEKSNGIFRISNHQEAIVQDFALIPKITSWISFRDYRINFSSELELEKHDLPFFGLRGAKRESAPSADAWISIGKTNHYTLRDFETLSSLGIQVKFRESYNLYTSEISPAFCLARPGLGAIRDCLDNCVPLVFFGPRDVDYELSANQETTLKLGLGTTASNIQINDNVQGFLSEMRVNIGNYVEKNFVSIDSFALKITAVVGL